MMSLLRNTMTSKTGGYVTRRLHVPHEVWSQGGAKLNNVLEKVRVVEVLCSALEDLQNSSAEYFGSVNGGSGLGSDNLGRKEGEGWITKLEEFSSVCDGVVANFGKKLGVGEGFALKKTTGVRIETFRKPMKALITLVYHPGHSVGWHFSSPIRQGHQRKEVCFMAFRCCHALWLIYFRAVWTRRPPM
jgi:hypothetical protein